MLKVNMETDFYRLRNEWALKMPYPSKDLFDIYYKMDMGRNPHNDSYKPKRRTTAEIVSDLAFEFADGVLRQQYGRSYETWLSVYTEEDHDHRTRKFKG